MPLGIYISVPFCRTKCSFCNFASGVFSRELHERYIAHLEHELRTADAIARQMGGEFEREVDSIYLGGGTPSVLDPDHLKRFFAAARDNFDVAADAEITVECAPGTLSIEMIDTLRECGVNRVSLGVQSFVDQESRSVGRLHTRNITLTEIARLADAGINQVSVDLIAGLPYQTRESWAYSLDEVLATGVPHVSVYMLEVDDDSRLGRELIAGGTRYHAHHVPDDDLTADLYEQACDTLRSGGVEQYEISNFARTSHEENFGAPHLPAVGRCGIDGLGAPHLPDVGRCGTTDFPSHASRHNLKYWLRQPYLGFGVDAHSMLPALDASPTTAVRFATSDDLDALLNGAPRSRTFVGEHQAIEETYFLGLRVNRGVELVEVHAQFGISAVERYHDAIVALESEGLVEIEDGWLRLTRRGRLLSNLVFERFVAIDEDGEKMPTSEAKAELKILR